MKWFVQRFQDLSTEDLYRILALRERVFTIDQECHEPDFDFKDFQAIHVFAKKDFEVVAYARFFEPDEKNFIKFGRVVVSPDVRGQRLGSVLVQQTLEAIETLHPGIPIKISAQSYILSLYKKYGFKVTSDEYMEAGILHREMIRAASV